MAHRIQYTQTHQLLQELDGLTRPERDMVSADVQSATKQEALAAGAVGFVNKPFQPGDLLAEVQRWTPRTP